MKNDTLLCMLPIEDSPYRRSQRFKLRISPTVIKTLEERVRYCPMLPIRAFRVAIIRKGQDLCKINYNLYKG